MDEASDSVCMHAQIILNHTSEGTVDGFTSVVGDGEVEIFLDVRYEI